MPNSNNMPKGVFQNGIFRLIYSSLLCIGVTVFIILFSVRINIFDENFFKREFVKYNVDETLKGIDIESINMEVLDYFKGKSELKTSFFTESEKAHLADVKEIIQTANYALLWTIIIIMLLLSLIPFLSIDRKRALMYLAKIVIIAGMLTIILNILLVLAVSINFQSAFDRFHRTFFKSGTWLFDPASEKIVVLYPEGLFYDFGIRIIISNLIFSGFLIFFGLVNLVMLKKTKLWSMIMKSNAKK